MRSLTRRTTARYEIRTSRAAEEYFVGLFESGSTAMAGSLSSVTTVFLTMASTWALCSVSGAPELIERMDPHARACGEGLLRTHRNSVEPLPGLTIRRAPRAGNGIAGNGGAYERRCSGPSPRKRCFTHIMGSGSLEAGARRRGHSVSTRQSRDIWPHPNNQSVYSNWSRAQPLNGLLRYRPIQVLELYLSRRVYSDLLHPRHVLQTSTLLLCQAGQSPPRTCPACLSGPPCCAPPGLGARL